MQRTLMILLAVASLGVTVLIAVSVAHQPGPADGLEARSEGPTVFDRPLPLPTFSLTERSRQTVTLADLSGKVWIASFIFTHCPGPCPRITSVMAGLQNELSQHPRWDDLRLVSFSVDPQRDTPERLTEYAGLARADDSHWLFLTGARDEVWTLITQGFKQAVADNPDDPAMPIVHSQSLVLVDQRGRIRGFYPGLDQSSEAGTIAPLVRKKLLDDVERLLSENQ